MTDCFYNYVNISSDSVYSLLTRIHFWSCSSTKVAAGDRDSTTSSDTDLDSVILMLVTS